MQPVGDRPRFGDFGTGYSDSGNCDGTGGVSDSAVPQNLLTNRTKIVSVFALCNVKAA